MTVTIEMPPDMEMRLKQAADAEGVDIPTYMREAAASRLRHYDPARPLTEAELFTRINSGFPDTFWNRFCTLVAKRQAGTLTLDEQAELIAHTDQTENRDAERLRYLIELAKRRGTTAQALMADLELYPLVFD